MKPEQKKKVLFITYYWPPAGGSGVQRPVKFVKYLREFGWEPVVFTVSNGEYPEIDHSLQHDVPPNVHVIQAPTLEPYSLFRLFTGNQYKVDANLFHTKKKKSGWSKFLFWIRSNFFIPDARVMWIIPALWKLYPVLRKEKFDAIISTGPPHTVHLIAARLSKKFDIPWLADFRDPWTGIDYFETLSLTRPARNIHERLERRVLTTADIVITVSPFIKSQLEQISGREIKLITNGFDEENFANTPASRDTKFTIVHMGMLSGARNHPIFWKALEQLVAENEQFREALEVRLYGKVDPLVASTVPRTLASHVFIESYIKHDDVPSILQQAQVLYMPIHDCAIDVGFLPGKLFEYLAAKRPILCIGPPHGDSANLIRSLNAGATAGYTQQHVIVEFLRARFLSYQKNEHFTGSPDIDQFNRRNLTGALARQLNILAP